MQEHKELKKLVVMKLEERDEPTAKELYREIKEESPRMVKGFKSFVRIINSFNGIETKIVKKGVARVYTLK